MTAARSRRAAGRSLLVLASLAAGLVVLRTAWVSDDAFITFRTIDNAASGLGLRWNAAERVQTYTHPLWLLLLGAARAGLAAHLVYVLLIGGDFMSGRFLSAPFTVALALLASGLLLRTSTRAAAVCISAVAIGLLVPHPNLTSGAGFGLNRDEAIAATGIADERFVYFQDTGWVQHTHRRPPAPPDWVTDDLDRYGGQLPRTVQRKAVGYFGWLAGPRVHVIDQLGLCDPLLARLPAEPSWRIGHFERAVPAGYFESVDTGRNAIADPNLHAYYDRLALATRGPIWSLRRLRAIVGLNVGRFDHWRKAYAAGRHP